MSDSIKRPVSGLGHESSSSGGAISDPSKKKFELTKILREVQKANTRLDSYVKLESVQERLQKLEEKPTSSCSSDTSVTKRKVPPEVRVCLIGVLLNITHLPLFYLPLHPSPLHPFFNFLPLFYSSPPPPQCTHITHTHTHTHSTPLLPQ